jgi:cobyrinic acid a,c-diamide synthase
MLRSALSALEIPLLGALPRRDALTLPDRHLGLVLPGEVERFDEVVSAAAELMEDHLDLTLLTALSAPSPSLVVEEESSPARLPPLGQHIAIARDAAFAFLYPHWLRDWHDAGATVSFFSPLANEAPDPTAGAVFLPGGYPELHGEALATAANFHAGLHAARDRGALVYGECGGFMVLGQSLTDKAGITHRMAGLLPHETRIDRPKRVLGYRRLKHLSPLPFPAELNGHEFHYSSARRTHGMPLFEATDALGEALPAMGLVDRNVMGSYAHVIDIA